MSKIKVLQRYVIARANQPTNHLVDMGANGGLAGADMLIVQNTQRKIKIAGVDEHKLTGLDVGLLLLSLTPRKDLSLGFFMNMPTLA